MIVKRSLTRVLIAVAIQYGCGDARRAYVPVAPSHGTDPSKGTPRPTPLVDLTGTYELTFTQSPSCSTVVGIDPLTRETVPFPEEVRRRTYPAQVTEDATGNVQMVLRRGECDPCTADGQGGALDITLIGRDMTFAVPGSEICAGGDYWWESLSADREWFEVCGGWSASVEDPQHIAGIHAGTFAYHHLIDLSVSPTPHRGGAWVDIYCSAIDHHFTLTRR